MAGISDLTGKLPIPDISGASILSVTSMLLIGIVVCVVLGIGIFLLVRYFRFKEHIVLFKKIGGEFIPVYKDKGLITRVGKTGDYWIIWLKAKKIAPNPTKRMGKNLIWYYEGEDGEVRNFCLDDLNENAKRIGCKTIDQDMRLARISIQKTLKDELQKMSFLDKYGGIIGFALFILIITVCLVIMFNRMETVANMGIANQGAVLETAKELKTLTQAVSNIANNVYSGARPV